MSKKRKIESTAKVEHHSASNSGKKHIQSSKKPASKEISNGLEKIFLGFPYIWIVLLGVLLYFRVAGFDFVGLDDKPIIINNYSIIGDISNWQVAFEKDAFLRDFGSFYRPVQTLSFMIDAQFGGKDASVYHIVNILLHLLVACSIFLLLKEMKYHRGAALAVSMLFVVHPLLTHAVAWIPARNDLLITLFCLLAFIFFIRYTRSKKYIYLVLHILLITLAFFTKETALAFPAICILYSVLIDKNKLFDKKHIISGIIWVALMIFWFILRSNAIGFKWGDNDFGAMVLLKNIQIVPEIVTKFIFPYHLPVLATFDTVMALIGIVIIIGAIVLIKLRKTARWQFLLFGVAWFLLMIIPGTMYRHSFADYFYDYLDHRAYLPIVGFLMIMLELIPKKAFNFNNYKAIAGIFAVIIIYGAVAYNHSSNYADRLAFRGKAAKDSPDKAGFRLAYGKALKEEGKIDEAEKEFLDGIAQMPQEQDFYFQLGEIYFLKKEYEKTISFMEKGIEIDPTKTEGYNNLGGTFMSMGRYDDALKAWEKAYELDTSNFGAANELIKLLSRMGRYDRALSIANSLINQGKNPPGMLDLYISLGYNEYKQGNIDKAIEYSDKAIAINPNSATAYNNLGTYYGTKKDYDIAIEMWEKAYSINKELKDSPQNIYNVYLNILKSPQKAAPWAKILLNKGANLPEKDIEALKPFLN